jgi:hypothetical protein
MMLQLNPTIPVYAIDHETEGYAFVIQDYSQEHDSLFLVGLDNGEMWWIKQSRLRLCKNISMDRLKIKNS